MRHVVMETLNIGGFDRDLAFRVAEAEGVFADFGISVTFTQVRNSAEELSGLLAGKWDIAFDNGDNVVAWSEGQGADRKPHDLLIFMGGSQELTQSLYGGPEINDIQDFKGKILAVDAVATGYAVVLRYILQCHGLHFKEDYDLEPVGSSQARLEKIAKGKLAGAMLNPRYAQCAEAPRLHLLAAGRDYAHPYPSRVGFTSRAWANSHSSLLVGFIQASLIAIEWLLDPQHSSEAISLIQRAFRQTEEEARISYEKAVDPTGVFASKAAFSPAALRTVLDLRVQTGLMKSPAPPIEKYYDASFYQKAQATARV